MNYTGDNDSLIFTGTNTFSIRCGKCSDIHNAQLEGKNTKPCECDCHGHVCPQPYYPIGPVWCETTCINNTATSRGGPPDKLPTCEMFVI